jgi:pilus assembly protein CpaB
MARVRGPILIVSSLLLACGAAWMANKWIAARAAPIRVAATTLVLTAAIDLPLGTTISTRHVRSIEMIPGQEPAGTFHDEHEIDGKVTSVNVQAGQLLMASMFAKQGETALAANVEKNKRAVTVRVDDVVGVAGFLLPGSHVDVVATRKDDRTSVVTSDTILSNVKVLAVDQTAATNSNEPVVVRAVTLEVTPLEAELLLKGKAAGSIQLALRNPLDDGDARHTESEPIKIKAQLPQHVAAPVRDPTITIIRGTSVAQQAERD